jgi:4-aminobutyrate aminotransferase
MEEKKTVEGDSNISQERRNWENEITDENTKRYLEDDARYFLHQSLSTPCLDVICKSSGSGFITLSGKHILDFHGNNVHQLGYNNRYLTDLLKEQIDELAFSPRRYANIPSVALARKLAELLPGDLNRCLFAPGGTLAVSTALKLARVVTGKFKIISNWDSFHGSSLDSISVGGEEEFSRYMEPLLPGVIHIPPVNTYRGIFNSYKSDQLEYADYLEYVIEKEGNIGAFITETIRNTDVQIPTSEYWKRVREICTRHNVLLILDEIPTSPGRTGELFAFRNFNIDPDILCLGKGLGGGLMPFAAIVARDRYNVAGDVSLGHYTHEKSPLGSRIALAVINSINDDQFLKRINETGKLIREELLNMQKEFQLIGDVRGIGMLWGIELVKDRSTREKANIEAEKIMYYCLRHGLNFKVSQGNVIQLSPALTINSSDLSKAFSILRDAFSIVK